VVPPSGRARWGNQHPCPVTSHQPCPAARQLHVAGGAVLACSVRGSNFSDWSCVAARLSFSSMHCNKRGRKGVGVRAACLPCCRSQPRHSATGQASGVSKPCCSSHQPRPGARIQSPLTSKMSALMPPVKALKARLP